MNRVSKIAQSSFLLFTIISAGLFLTNDVEAATTCTFDRDLQLGIIGEDVRCLQRYLNNNGFTVATTGVGSPGRETNEFKLLTEAALIRWQKANGLSASGYFGPRSQQMYRSLVTGGTDTTAQAPASGVDTSIAAIMKKVEEAKAQMSSSTSTATVPALVSTTANATAMRQLIKSLQSAEKEVSKNEKADDYEDALDSLTDARGEFYAAVLAILSGDSREVAASIEEAKDKIDEALAYIRNKDIEDYYDEVESDLDDAWDEVDEAIDDRKDIGDAEDLLDEAEDLLDDAKDAIDDGDEDEAADLLDEAADLIEEALDEL